jgi:thymidylate synthase (FAD)
MVDDGVAKEVARMHLPLNLYSSAYVRMNLRALMNFLSLRTHSEDARDPSFPMHEIAYLAGLYEADFAYHFPIVYEAWVMHGRVAP